MSLLPHDTSALPDSDPTEPGQQLIGLARLMTLAFHGADLRPVASTLIARAERDATDAAALMDLSTVLFLQGLPDLALATQSQALGMERLYRLQLPDCALPRLRMLAVMAPGDLMTNTPLSFLVEDGRIALDMLFVLPGEGLPELLPEHDVLYMAISESDATHGLLERLSYELPAGAVLNHPSRILETARDRAYDALRGAPGIAMPASARSGRLSLQAVGDGRLAIAEMLEHGRFPLIVRPVDSHAGHGLEKVTTPAELVAYLAGQGADEYFVSNFIDYAQADGLFRKYRVVLVDGMAYAAHMGVSSHWMIHYLNAGMTECADKRAEEAAFMRDFDTGFGLRHREALSALAGRIGLDYLVVDCGETPEGDLLVFEVDPGAVVHRMDPPEVFSYKRACMDKLYAAFDTLVMRAGRPA
ncbi:RimK family alpha-L-glutamate ligase [Xylophilus sp. GOD-11R]|uniref:ATP-grasp domain-containing protein n=1 Tax=Xylophilus sp. GOD-11R TaxID=3089814 RepID=UPI00298D30B1|nr:RimK family alpha-L-glutamate ligase [Xylophilus sp. GOD-11R]WPB58798.1 RimK family alpha-L-glutamate ligase [Xylophilus sp. GOD-11R]